MGLRALQALYEISSALLMPMASRWVIPADMTESTAASCFWREGFVEVRRFGVVDDVGDPRQ